MFKTLHFLHTLQVFLLCCHGSSVHAVLAGNETVIESLTTEEPPPTPPEVLQPLPPAVPNKSELLNSRTLYIDPTLFPGEACNRVCMPGDRRVCYFHFTLEHYQAMGVACGACADGNLTDCETPQCILGDGISKGVMSINRMLPGPAIRICKDDNIIVDVANNAQGTAAAIHWHGLHLRDTPYSDGVPFVTQCPIPFATTHRYQFQATEAGTHFYHSHSGHHKVNGQYGALIVRQPVADEVNARHYDYDDPDHYILISDWMHSYGEQYFPGLPTADGIYPSSVLINGRGTYIDPDTDKRTAPPPTIYKVKPGKKYRMRLINSISHVCPFQLQIERHNLTIIASDSYNVDPRPFDTLVSNAGERYDFVLDANHTSGDFWIRVRGMAICAIHPTEAFALLRYVSNDATQDDERPVPAMPHYNETFWPGIYLNHPNATCFNNDHEHCVTELHATDQDEQLLSAKPDHTFFLAFHNYPVPNEEIFRPGTYNHFANLLSNLTIVGAINNLSMIFPPYPPLTQPRDIVDSDFCDESHWPETCKGNRLCPCVHRLEIRLNSIVELFIVDESEAVGRLHHPFHLHGYKFMVTSLGQHPFGVPMTVPLIKEMERTRSLPRSPFNARPPFKDTVSIPSSGFAVVRFRADNPGFWMMHCHYEWHLSIGMGLILQVGKTRNMVSPPKDFPKCGNYLPRVRRLR